MWLQKIIQFTTGISVFIITAMMYSQRGYNTMYEATMTGDVHSQSRTDIGHMRDNSTDHSVHSTTRNRRTITDSNMDSFIFVHSAVQNVRLRKAVRNTWASKQQQEKHGFRVLFVVGYPSQEYPELREVIDQEMDTFSDLLRVDIKDSYYNLTLKSLAALQWCHRHCHTQTEYVIKMDDDTFLNMENLRSRLKKYRNMYQQNIPLIGHVIEDSQPIRQRHSKYYVPVTSYRKQFYPPYLSGSAYVLPAASVSQLLDVAKSVEAFWLEDVFITGILGKKANKALLHDPGFNMSKRLLVNPVTEVCKNSTLTIHELTAEEIWEFWQHKKNCVS